MAISLEECIYHDRLTDTLAAASSSGQIALDDKPHTHLYAGAYELLIPYRRRY